MAPASSTSPDSAAPGVEGSGMETGILDEAMDLGGVGGGEHTNAVSLLQEYVQSCAPFMPKAKILTWEFEQQLGDETSLQFRATVSFIFHNIPHQFSGGWQSSKKKAQRDAAERVRAYLAKSLPVSLDGAPAPPPLHPSAPGSPPQRSPTPTGEEGASDDVSGGAPTPIAAAAPPSPRKSAAAAHKSALDPRCLPEAVVQELWAVFGGRSPSFSSTAASDEGEAAVTGEKLAWELEERDSDGMQRATVSFYIYAVPHHFRGDWCAGVDQARMDIAERVLFYFGKRPEAFVAAERPRLASSGGVEVAATRRAGLQAPASPCAADVGGATATVSPAGAVAGTPQGAAVGALQAPVEEKTVLMQVQNALQKTFAKETPPGQRVWVWSYDADPSDQQLFRARVEVPCWGGRTFTGEWCRGKKLAQRSACLEVKRELEAGAADHACIGTGA